MWIDNGGQMKRYPATQTEIHCPSRYHLLHRLRTCPGFPSGLDRGLERMSSSSNQDGFP